MKQIGSTQITILDLVDYATYIYYAEDSQGTNATNTPNDNTKYIGVYCGPPVEGGQPETPVTGMEIEWMSYVGPKGDPGGQGPAGSSSRPLKTYLRKTLTFAQWQGKLGVSEKWQYNTMGAEVSDAEWNAYYADIQIGDTIYFQIEASDTAQRYVYHGRVSAIDRKAVTALGISLSLDSKDGTPVTIKSQHYAVGDSGTIAPTPESVWKTSTDQLTLTQGKYLWTRIIYLSNGQDVVSYSISYIAKDGENGDAYEIRTTSEDLVYFHEKDGLVSLPSTSIEYAARNKLTGEWVSFSDTNFSGKFKVVFGSYEYPLPDNCYSPSPLGFNGEKQDCISLAIGTINELTCKEVTDAGSEIKGSLIEKILSDGGYIVYYLIDGNKTLAVKPLLPRYGTSSEMAQFNITATSINQAVKNAYMAFTDTGLNLSFKENDLGGYDGGLKIFKSVFNPETEKNDEIPVFYADAEGNLSLTGAITATGGDIGGFRVVNSTLQSVNGGLTLDGENGIISAGTIKLSENAQIEKFIKLGDKAVLWNPAHEESNGLVLQSGGVSIYDDGRITLGNRITISSDGKTGSLSSGTNGSNWRIEDEKAYFKNIDVSGTINSAVFNTETTQAVGGTMIFLPSFKVDRLVVLDPTLGGLVLKFYIPPGGVANATGKLKSATFCRFVAGTESFTFSDPSIFSYEQDQEGKTFFTCRLDSQLSFEPQMFYIADQSHLQTGYSVKSFEYIDLPPTQNYQIYLDTDKSLTDIMDLNTRVWLVRDNVYEEAYVSNISDTEAGQKSINVSRTSELTKIPQSVIVLGNANTNPIIMGLNSGSSLTADDYVYGRGLTISTYNEEGAPPLPNLFLGDLGSLKITDYKGYGLYCNNAILNGSLTTIGATTDGKTMYAGVTTLGDLVSNKLKEDKSKIVFWAGGTSAMGDADAPFHVTENGSVYAQRAYLEDSVFAKGTITSTTIETACIRGTGKDPGLVIYDTNSVGGIQFKSGYDTDSPQTTMTIRGTSIEVLDKTVIEGTESGIVLSGDVIRTQYNDTGSYIALQMVDNIPTLYHEHSSTNNCGFYFGDGSTAYKIKATTDTSPKTKVVFGQETKFIGTVMFAKDEKDASFSYKVSDDGGYNLYITSRKKEEK